MAIIRVTCDNCWSNAELPSARVSIVEHVYFGGTTVSTYQYDCPGCGEFVIKNAEPHVVEALQAGNVKLRRVYVVAPSKWHVHGEISNDDVIDFYEALENVITIDDLTIV